MGRLDAKSSEKRRTAPSVGGPDSGLESQITELGDPDFSPSNASQGQVTAASAQKKQLQNARSAQKVLADAEQFGYDTSGADFDPLRQAANTGIKEEEGSFIASAVGWIDGPRQAVNLLIQDMIGGSARDEFRNPNFADYWNAWWSGIDDPEAFKLATGLSPISGSVTLDMFGLEEQEGLAGRIGRGVLDFGLQVLTDPLTYLTFGLSGLTKKAALTAGREMQARGVHQILSLLKKPASNSKLYANALEEAVETGVGLSPYFRHLGRNLEKHITSFTDDIAQFGGKMGGNLPPDMAAAFSNYLGKGTKNLDYDSVVELALANEMFKDVIQPVLNRSFGKVNRNVAGREFRELNKLALKELPAFMSGGARISVPFFQGNLRIPGRKLGTLQAGIVIPGTQGLGRKLVGDPIRLMSEKFKTLGVVGDTWDGLLTAISKGASKMDQFTPIIRGLKDGSIEGWQYHIAARAIDNMTNNAAKHQIASELAPMWKNITELADDAGKDLSDVGRDLMIRLDSSDLDEIIVDQVRKVKATLGDIDEAIPGKVATGNKNLDQAMNDMVIYLQETMEIYRGALAVLDPDFADKFIKGYVPHSVLKPARDVIQAFSKESSGKAGKGNTAEDVWAQLLNAAGVANASAPLVGGSMHIGRGLGRAQALQIYADNLLMLDKTSMNVLALEKRVNLPFGKGAGHNPTTLEEVGLSVPELNDLLKPIIEREAERLKIRLPKDWDGKIFNENPLEVMMDYLDNMTDAINSWNLMDALRASGLAFTHTAELNLQDVARNIVNNAMRDAASLPMSHFGRPVDGETAMAPLDFLERITQVKDADQAALNIAGKPGTTVPTTATVDSVRKSGVKKPVVVEVWEDGSYRLADGHNRVASAAQAGNVPEIPVVFVPAGNTPAPKNGTAAYPMDMQPGWFDIATETTGGASAVRGAEFRKGNLGFVEGDPTWEAYQALENLPWGPTPLEKNLLHGGANQGPIPGVPLNVHQDLSRAGVVINNLEDVADIRTLANDVVSTEPAGWATPVAVGGTTPNPVRQIDTSLGGPDQALLAQSPGAHDWRSRVTGNETLHVFSEAVGVKGKQGLTKTVKAAVRIIKGNNGVGTKIHVAIKGGTVMELQHQRRSIVEFLGRAFDEGGDLEGMFSSRGFKELQASGMDEQTSELLHEFARNKLGTIPREAKEFISKEPAEIFDARLLYEETRRGLDEWIADVTGVRIGGTLISGEESIILFGTDETVKRLRGLQDAANSLSEKGYEDISKIMRDVDSFTGVQTIDKMINPLDFNLQGPAIADLSMQSNVAEWLSLTARNMGAIYTPEGIAAAKRAAMETLRIWRGLATLPRPAFHIRNLVGGSWMNLSVGVTPETSRLVARHTIAFRNAIRNAKPGTTLNQIFDQLPAGKVREGFREAMSRNVLAGFATTEFSGALTPRAMAKRWDFLNAMDIDNFILTRAGGRIMESVEDFMRMSLFMQYYDHTVKGSGLFAAELVNVIHFNYANLTPMETTMKSWVPFFVWSRRNIPLQLRMGIENPRYIQKYRAMMQAMNDNLGGNDEANLQEADHFTAWAAGTDYKVNPDTPFWARIMIDPDLPISDLLELPNITNPKNLAEFADGLLGPHISFLGDVNAQRDLGDVNAPAPFNAVLQSLAAFGLYNRTTDGDVRMSYLMRTLLETGLPFSREIGDPLSGGPTDPNRQQRLGIKEDDNFVTSTLKSIGGQLLGGVGVKMTTPADARSAGFRTSDEIQKLIKELRLQGKLPLSDEGDAVPAQPHDHDHDSV